ncbi:PREDICTED: F-box protein At3g07870-like [Nelumbo nucifera]|uniref:F-box protein At3g07870-like n=2 Tax=Nelumbo nucifera TaxID=4432 RepID=A0A1U8B9H7_NELNU|nr:PREDICTED: F-box protein At3g07870-like [Nelumbo nucifera]DAD25107.1 TPA_asm: hypothetical protein HUJ06_026571 [Nelumbo nucifera]
MSETRNDGKRSRRKKNRKVDFENVPEEIIFLILVNIPAHVLYGLRPVCKLWTKLISEPSFIDQHLSRSESALLGQYRDPTKEWYILSTACLEKKGEKFRVRDLSIDLPYRFRICASCNGLILLDDIHHQSGDLFVGNPITKECVKIPANDRLSNSSYSFRYGFTFHPVTRDYKVLIFHMNKDFRMCEILTLGSATWRHVTVLEEFYPRTNEHISTKGFLHYLTNSLEEDKDYMCSIDTADETFHRTPLPVCGRQDRLLECGGFLAFATRVDSTAQFDIWVLKDFCGGGWVKQHTVVLEGVKFARKRSLSVIYPVGSLKDGKIIVFTDTISFYAADVELKIVKRIWKLRFAKLLPHVNSLVSCKIF